MIYEFRCVVFKKVQRQLGGKIGTFQGPSSVDYIVFRGPSLFFLNFSTFFIEELSFQIPRVTQNTFPRFGESTKRWRAQKSKLGLVVNEWHGRQAVHKTIYEISVTVILKYVKCNFDNGNSRSVTGYQNKQISPINGLFLFIFLHTCVFGLAVSDISGYKPRPPSLFIH